MSKLLGKIFLEEEKNEDEYGKLLVRYLKTVDSFEFKGFRKSKDDEEKELGISFKDLGEKKDVLVVPSLLMFAMLNADKVPDVVYKWSIGYKTKEKRSDPREVLNKEREYLISVCGKEMFLGFAKDDFLDVCRWQYLYKVSNGLLEDVMRQWKRRKWNKSECVWINVEKRLNEYGREKGSKNKNRFNELESESDEEFKERIEHNKKAGIEKGYLAWYLDACREECKRAGVRFEKEKCLKEWKECRKISSRN